jgi:hypothetical protein
MRLILPGSGFLCGQISAVIVIRFHLDVVVSSLPVGSWKIAQTLT